VRRPAHDLAVLERARLGLVGVAGQIVRLAVAELHERPLEARREAGAAAAAQARVLHDVLDRDRIHREGLLQRLVAAERLPGLELARLGVAEVLGEDRRLSRMTLVRVAHYAAPGTEDGRRKVTASTPQEFRGPFQGSRFRRNP